MANSRQEVICRNIFLILLGQLVLLALWSLPARKGIILVPPWPPPNGFFGVDYFDFYSAATDWVHKVDPYLRTRFFTPPPSLLAGLGFVWLPFGVARYFFFVVNIVIVVASVRACSRRLGLSEESVRHMTGIALLFCPTYFLLERGNLEGLVLGCLSWAFCTRNVYVRAAMVGVAEGIKLYPLLLLAPAVRNRLWRFALGSLIAFFLLLLPFWRVASSFFHALAGRGARFQLANNISPAEIMVVITGVHIATWIFGAYWGGTLLLMLWRQRSTDDGQVIWPFVPWMISVPMTVYPYSAVLLLPVLAWRLREMQDRERSPHDAIFVTGFLLVGLQTYAFTRFLQVPILVVMNSLGMCLILGSLAIPRLNRNRAARAKPEPGAKSEPQPA